MEYNTVDASDKKLYKVLRNVGVKPKYIKRAESIDDLYLDELDQKLLVHYFENEFNVELNNNEIKKLTNLSAFRNFIKKQFNKN